MERLLGALVLIVGPAVAFLLVSRAGGASAWRMLGAAALGGAASGPVLLLFAWTADAAETSGATAGVWVRLIAGALAGGAGVGVVIGAIVLLVRLWWRAPAPPV